MAGKSISKEWRRLYRSDEHLKRWEYGNPSPELVTAIACGIIPKDATVLDVGCGTGSDAIFLARSGFNSIGLDLTIDAIRIATRKSNGLRMPVSWIVGNVLEMPFSDRSVDFISDRGCLHHIDYDNWLRYMDEVGRVLKPGGTVLIRGSRFDWEGYFAAINDEQIDSSLVGKVFQRGPVLQIGLVSDSGNLEASIVLLRRID